MRSVFCAMVLCIAANGQAGSLGIFEEAVDVGAVGVTDLLMTALTRLTSLTVGRACFFPTMPEIPEFR